MQSHSQITLYLHKKEKFNAKLSGQEEVPPVQTTASGMAWFKPMQDKVWFKVNVTDMQGVTQAHIHYGKVGENGPVVVTLYKSDTPQPINGKLAYGNITANLLEGPMKGKQLSDLATTMSNGSTYVNVHTEKHPNGEIRGQIMMANSTSDKMMMMDK
ncbi:MAG: CHRD domain-containing protein [Nitrososphaeraceae archaeon]